ncbi:hypothetical protein HYFRA_00005322 [Hymenoscyphus fraxineus]|uniref:Conserved oligomeric Golgi complex subunit 1 n=1 Tax=Hymenoscyphus fraxineus TaxID=746836 RepID=A0A9N9LDG7_9HELO|nr:hypothetical protein HYFRA_00005322 [Hymenoscyphus fraxineus]
MATTLLSPSTTTTSAEAFLAPLPQVRQFHRQLTTSLDEKNARLRTLVGGSYRQLLGTAETILEMRRNIDIVEEKLGRVGKGCGRSVVGKMAEGLGGLDEESGNRERARLEWAARMKVLGQCGLVVGRLVKGKSEGRMERGARLVSAAKVLVLNRLLAKSTGDLAKGRKREDREAVEEARRKYGVSRRRVLGAIEKMLERTDGEESREDLLLALSAYSLATGSGAKDVLRYFLKVRGEALELAFEDDEKASGIVKALELYSKTLLDVQAVVITRLPQALAALKSKPLLKDNGVREIEALRLDVCEKWFGDDILFFTPYIRHDDLSSQLAVDTLKSWATKASEVLLQGFGKSLQKIHEFKAVVDLRTKVLQIWIKDGGKAKRFDPSIVLDGLRKVINDRMVQLLESRIKKLHLVTTEVEGTLENWHESKDVAHGSLWDEEMLEMDVSNGASLFREAIIARAHGRNDAVSRVYKGYQTWRKLVDEIVAIISQLKKQRWDDDLEDIEDDDTLETRNHLLSTEDPNMLQEHLSTGLEKAYKGVHEKLGTLLISYEDKDEIGPISIYIIRLIRDLRASLPPNQNLQAFGLALIPRLHERLALTVSVEPLKVFEKSLRRKKVAGRALWEGSPELPVQPSPASFKLLNNLTLAMAEAGSDLWSKTAIEVLKEHVCEELEGSWSADLKRRKEEAEALIVATTSKSEPEPEPESEHESEAEVKKEEKEVEKEGDDQPTSPTSPKPQEPTSPSPPQEPASPPPQTTNPQMEKDILIQALFDTLFLQQAFEVPDSTSDGLTTLSEEIRKEIEGGMDASSNKRLSNSAREYWKRTGLLFGLLGSGV